MNFKHMLGTMALAAAAVALPLSAAAQPYLGAGLGTSDAREFCRDITDCDKTGTTWRAFAGWRFSRHLAAELAYVDLGRFTHNVGGTRTRVEGDGPEATLLAIYQVNQVSIFGRIGGYYANTKAAVEAPTGSTATKEKNSGLTYGLGLQYDFTGGLGARLEWQHYAKVGDSNTTGSALDINAFTLSLLYRFR
jgi:OmpA-OmpF porin, OOP family